MVMVQGFTAQQVESILSGVEATELIDDKTKALLRYAEKATRHAYKVEQADIENLRSAGYPDEEILEAAAVIAAFNMIDRIADALGVETEHFQEMIAAMQQSQEQ